MLLLFLFQAELAMEGVRHGLALYAKSVFPALFPFLVLSELILSGGIGSRLGSLLARPFRVLFGVSKTGSSALVLGTLCGQPVASCAAISLFEQGQISRKEAQRISLFANNPSSGFLIAVVGGALFGNTGAGVALFCITLLSSALLGIELHFLFGKTEQIEYKCHNGTEKSTFSTKFTIAVQRALSTLLQLGAFLVFFSALASILAGSLVHTPLDSQWRVPLLGILEITTGIHAAITSLPAYSAFRFAAFLSGFGGICVCMQILSLTQKCAIQAWQYLLAKLFQGGIALLLCEGYLRLFQPVLIPAQSIPTGIFHTSTSIIAIACCALPLIAFLCFSKERQSLKNKRTKLEK